jgi:hypothetical protein
MTEEKKIIYEKYSITVLFSNPKYAANLNLFDITYANDLNEFFERTMSCINRIRSDGGVPTEIIYTKTKETKVFLSANLFLDRYAQRKGMMPKTEGGI